MHACTVIAYTLEGEILCPDCAGKLDSVGSACGEPFPLSDPGWHDCGKADTSGSPCHAVTREAQEGTADDACPVFAEQGYDIDGDACGDCGSVWVDEESDWYSSADYRASVRYCAGWNMPGYLPDTCDPLPRFASDEDARQYLIDAIERAADEAETDDEANALALFAEDINLTRGEVGAYGPDGLFYFITDEDPSLGLPACDCGRHPHPSEVNANGMVKCLSCGRAFEAFED